MSISNNQPAAATFVLQAHTNVDAEVLILDGGLNIVARGVGSVSRQLPKGLYKVKSNRGGSTVEQLVELTRDRGDIFLGTSDFPAIAPIGQVLGNDWPAVESFGSAGRKSGGDASILIMAHADAESTSHNLLAGLRLFAWGGFAHGERLGPIAKGRTIGKRRWCVAGKIVKPGTHVLEMAGGIRQAVLAVAGWETRVFIHRTQGETDETRSGSFDVSIQMARRNAQIVYSDHLETIEVARNSLASSRPIFVSSNLIDQLLHDKFDNPILGITGLHLFLQAVEREASPQTRSVSLRLEPDLAAREQEIVTEVLINLTALLTGGNGPMPPDLVALLVRAGRLPDAGIVISEPPMFWASWDAVRKASGPGCNVTVERRLWNSIAYSAPSGPYLSWKRGRTTLRKYLQQVAPHLPGKAVTLTREGVAAEDDELGVLYESRENTEGVQNDADWDSDSRETVNESTTAATAPADPQSTSATLDLVDNGDLRILLGIPVSVALSANKTTP